MLLSLLINPDFSMWSPWFYLLFVDIDKSTKYDSEVSLLYLIAR